MYLYYLYEVFSDKLTGFSSLAIIASGHPCALLSSSRDPIRAGSHSVHSVARNCHPEHIPKPEATLNASLSISVESVDRDAGENSLIRYPQ
jgi:hypothetical protein